MYMKSRPLHIAVQRISDLATTLSPRGYHGLQTVIKAWHTIKGKFRYAEHHFL